jgi:cation diffusion facilitator CzcD-associated flavoprotein CzcO
MLSDHPLQAGCTEVITQTMHARLKNAAELIKQFVPQWTVGCHRRTPGDGYLEALQEKNAKCDWDPILRITERGIETSKGVEEFDLIVCATGFDVSFKPHWHTVGRNEKLLERDWAMGA